MRPVCGFPENFGELNDYAHGYFFRKFMGLCSGGTAQKSVGEFLYALHAYSSISNRLSKILDCSFEWGCEPPILWKGRLYGVGNGTIRKSLGDLL